MILYTGGKYQGKLLCALNDNNYTDKDVCDFDKIEINQKAFINDASINSSDDVLINQLKNQIVLESGKKPVWTNIEELIRKMALAGFNQDQIENIITDVVRSEWPEVVIISEVGGGVIPMKKEDNIFREATGRVTVDVAKLADKVKRVVCGLTMDIK